MRSAYESGLQYYEVQFFIINNDQTPLTEDQINAVWDSADHDGKTVFTRRVTANNFYLSGLSQSGQGVYWRVKAVANDGAGADASSEVWSENYHFSPVGGNVTPPSASTDAPNITINSEYQYISGSPANSITVDWKGSLATAENGSGIAFYILYYKEEGESTYKTIRLAYNAENEYSTVISGLSKINQNVSYYITARDNSGNESEALKSGIFQGDVWAPEGAALTQVIPDDPNSMYVTNGTGGLDFVVTLQVTCGTDNEHSGIAPSGNYLYTLQYSKESTGGTTQWITIDSRYQSQLGDRTSYTVTAPGIDIRDLPVGEDNKCPTYWQLVVTDEAGNKETISLGPIYATMPGDVKFDASVSLTKDVQATDQQHFTVSLSWGNASSTVYALDYYALSISTDGTNWKEVYTVDHDAGRSQYTFEMTEIDLKGDTTYYWRVEAFDTEGFSATVDGPSFTTPVYVPPPEEFEFGDETISVSYANGDWNQLNITISWNTTSGVASGYVLQRAVIGSDTWETFLTGTDTTFNFTVSASDANYQYRIAAQDGNYGGQLVVSDAIYTPAADSHAPQFSSTTTSLTQNGSTVNLTWSEALDTLYSTQEAVSGFKEYMLYFSTSPDMSNRIAIYAGSSTSYTLTRDIMIANGIDDGTYYWSVSAVDNVGNESTLVNGSGSFSVKFSPPEGSFSNLESSLSVTYEYVDDPEIEGGAQLRQPLTITATFQFDPNSFAAGEVAEYEIQFSSSADFNPAYILLSDKFTGTSYTLSTENNGIAYIAAMAQGSNGYYSTIDQVPNIYWRVRAVDSNGNATSYSTTQTFKLFDNVTPDGSGTLDRPLNDYYGPNTPKLTSIEEVFDADGNLGLNIGWEPSHDAFGIKTYILTISNGITSFDLNLYDSYGPMIYETGKIVVGIENLPPDVGTYTFTLKAVDGSGKVSGTSNALTYTNHNADPSWNDYPGRGTSSTMPYILNSELAEKYTASVQSTVGTDAGNVEHWFYCTVTGNGSANLSISGNVENLKLTIWEEGNGKQKKRKSITVKAGGGGIYNYLLPAGVYLVSVESTDKKKFTKDTNYSLNFTSDYFPAENSTSTNPTALDLSQTESQITASVSDFTGYGDSADYYYFVSSQAGALNISITTSAKVKVFVYGAGMSKKLASKTLSKAGTYENIFSKDVLCPAGEIYIVVESADKGKGTYNAFYTMNVNDTLFPAENATQTNPITLAMTQSGSQLTATVSDFTGYGDPSDYYFFESAQAGAVNISITTSAKVKVFVYGADMKKKLASITLAAGSYTDIFKKAALCPAGGVYIVVESADKGKGTYNAFYTMSVTDNLFPTATPNSTLDASAQTITLNATGQGSFSGGWVGFGDSVDTYSFVAGANGAVELGITEVESKLKVTLYNSAGKALKSKTITGSPSAKYSTTDIFGTDILLNAGQTYYVAVESGDKGKGYQNSSYNILVNETYAPASRGNNDITTAMQLTAGSTQSDWVGYGEPSDFYKISLTDGGYVDLNFNYSGKVTLKMTTSESKSVSLQKTDFGYSSKQWLAAGDYFLEIRASSPNSVTTWSNSYNLAYSSRA